MINNIIYCEFNIDTVCVEVKLTDGSMVSIDCDAVENEYANNMYEVSELDYLIYKKPMSYVRLLLSGKMEEYLPNNTDYTIIRYEIKFCRQHLYWMLPAIFYF